MTDKPAEQSAVRPDDPGDSSASPPSMTEAPYPVGASLERERQPVEFNRVLALSDGVFAIALTLLVLDLALPAGVSGESLGDDLRDRQSAFIAFGVSLLLVGSAWLSHHRLFGVIQTTDGTVLTLNILYLGLVVLIPFVQSVLGGYPGEPLAYVLFAGVLTALLAIDAAIMMYAHRARFLASSVDQRYYRREVLRSAIVTGAFAVSIPLAYVLGPFTIVIWLGTIPLNLVANRYQSGDVQTGLGVPPDRR